MNTVKRLNKYLFVGLLLSLTSNVIKADPVHNSEKAFASNAPRHELIDAYLRKCAEKHYLTQDLEDARKNCYSFKSLVKAFGVGAVVGIAASAILYIVTR